MKISFLSQVFRLLDNQLVSILTHFRFGMHTLRKQDNRYSKQNEFIKKKHVPISSC